MEIKAPLPIVVALIAQSYICFFSSFTLLPSLLPAGFTSQINYLHTVLFSGPAFGRAKIYINKYFKIFLGFVYSFLWLLISETKLLSFFGYHFLISGFELCLYPYVFATGELVYLSSCPLASTLFIF